MKICKQHKYFSKQIKMLPKTNLVTLVQTLRKSVNHQQPQFVPRFTSHLGTSNQARKAFNQAPLTSHLGTYKQAPNHLKLCTFNYPQLVARVAEVKKVLIYWSQEHDGKETAFSKVLDVIDAGVIIYFTLVREPVIFHRDRIYAQ